MSRNFRLYVSGADFPLEGWQFIMDVCKAHPIENSPTSQWQWQWIIALALATLPKSAPGVRAQAEDALDDASADTLEEWALIALRYLDRESVGDIMEWAISA